MGLAFLLDLLGLGLRVVRVLVPELELELDELLVELELELDELEDIVDDS